MINGICTNQNLFQKMRREKILCDFGMQKDHQLPARIPECVKQQDEILWVLPFLADHRVKMKGI